MDSFSVLFVDDEKAFLEQAKVFLERENERFEVEAAFSVEEALNLLDEKGFDAVVSDYQMPCVTGLDFLKTLREGRNSKIPFIMFTGRGREEVAMKALNLGADRYLRKIGDPKARFKVLANAVVQEIKHWRSVKEREDMRRRLEEVLERYRKITESSPDAIVLIDVESGEIIEANSSAEEMLKMDREEIVGSHFLEFHPASESGKYRKLFQQIIEEEKEGEGGFGGKVIGQGGRGGVEGDVFLGENGFHLVDSEGQKIPVELSSTLLEIGGRKVWRGSFRDISKRRVGGNVEKK